MNSNKNFITCPRCDGHSRTWKDAKNGIDCFVCNGNGTTRLVSKCDGTYKPKGKPIVNW